MGLRDSEPVEPTAGFVAGGFDSANVFKENILRSLGGSYLYMAAGELAIALGAQESDGAPDTMYARFIKAKEDGATDLYESGIETLLTERERQFLPAATRIVTLTVTSSYFFDMHEKSQVYPYSVLDGGIMRWLASNIPARIRRWRDA